MLFTITIFFKSIKFFHLIFLVRKKLFRASFIPVLINISFMVHTFFKVLIDHFMLYNIIFIFLLGMNSVQTILKQVTNKRITNMKIIYCIEYCTFTSFELLYSKLKDGFPLLLYRGLPT